MGFMYLGNEQSIIENYNKETDHVVIKSFSEKYNITIEVYEFDGLNSINNIFTPEINSNI